MDDFVAGDIRDGKREGYLRGHLESCVECRGRLAAFAAVEPPPASAFFSAFLAGEARRPTRDGVFTRRNVRRAFGVLGCAAAAVALFVFVGSKGPISAERTKGGLALTVFIKRTQGTVESVQGEGTLHPGDEMRFFLNAATTGHAVVVGLDAAPSVTVYVPSANGGATAAARVESTGDHVLPGSIVADETAGAERVFAVLCSTPRDPRAVQAAGRAALARAGGRPEAVSGLDSGCLEASVLLHKEPWPR